MSRIIAALLSAVCLAALASAVEPSSAGAAPVPQKQTAQRGSDSLCC